MKIFVSYRYTGESTTTLNTLLTAVKNGLEQNGMESFCSFFFEDHYRSHGFTSRQIMDHAFTELGAANNLLVILTSDEKSAGMLLEVGYAIARSIPIILAIREDVPNGYLRDMTEHHFLWRDETDLQDQLAHYRFETPVIEKALPLQRPWE
ncbi:hypothetical protein HY523_02830 [Candidatus Berkelbacteria bacterium]|nr:hypothetical protein [Candidatus Berkelbacteria bacterium]